jgi:hypothetical protein
MWTCLPKPSIGVRPGCAFFLLANNSQLLATAGVHSKVASLSFAFIALTAGIIRIFKTNLLKLKDLKCDFRGGVPV